MLIVPLVGGDKPVQALQVCQAHRGSDLRHFPVNAHAHHLVVTGESEVAHQAQPRRQVVVVADNGAAFKGVEELRGVETEHFGVTKPADHLALVRAAERVRGVKQQAQTVAMRDRGQRADVTRVPPDVDPDDAGRLRRDGCFHRPRVEGVGGGVDVAEDRGDAMPLQRVCRGHKREGGDNDLTVQFQRADGEFQRDGPVRDCDTMADAEQCGHALLELFQHRTVVGQPAAVEHVRQPL